MHRISFWVALMLLTAATVSAQLPAQPSGDRKGSPNGQERCPALLSAVDAGPESRDYHDALAWGKRCPGLGAAFGRRLSTLSRSTDVGAMNRYLVAVNGFRDADLYSAALLVAQDASATVQGRITAMVVLFRQPGFRYGGGMTAFLNPASGCALGVIPNPADVESRGKALPRDYVEQTMRLFNALEADSSNAVAVRWTAKCLNRYLALRAGRDRNAPPPLYW